MPSNALECRQPETSPGATDQTVLCPPHVFSKQQMLVSRSSDRYWSPFRLGISDLGWSRMSTASYSMQEVWHNCVQQWASWGYISPCTLLTITWHRKIPHIYLIFFRINKTVVSHCRLNYQMSNHPFLVRSHAICWHVATCCPKGARAQSSSVKSCMGTSQGWSGTLTIAEFLKRWKNVAWHGITPYMTQFRGWILISDIMLVMQDGWDVIIHSGS